MSQFENIPPQIPSSQPQQYQSRTTSGLGVTSMILGILSLLGFWALIVPPILAVVFGHISVAACKKDPNLDGRGMGIAGLVMGWICLAFWIIFLLFGGLAIIAGMINGANQHPVFP